MTNPFKYTNRKDEDHYIRAAETAKGGTRYYVTKSDNFPELIDALPAGFEINEDPYEGRVVLRKYVPCLVTTEEKDYVHKAVKRLSDLNDFMIQGDGDALIVWISQFNSIDGQGDNLTAKEAVKCFGESIRLWKKYDDKFRFILIDAPKRLFQAERRVYLSFGGGEYMPLQNGKGSLEKLVMTFCPHMGRESYFHTVPEGFDE